jgi:agmatine deiminase
MMMRKIGRRGLLALGLAGTAMTMAGPSRLGAGPAPLPAPDPRLKFYRMPLESAPHARTFMQWPIAADVYGRSNLAAVQAAIVRIANAISEQEPLVMLASPAARRGRLAGLSRAVEIWDIPTDDLWCRDSGPTFVVDGDGKLAVAHLRFNGWGNKQPHRRDALVAQRVAARLGVPLLETGLVGEQGGVEHDGSGLLLAHASCWDNRNRNRLSRDTIAERLCGALGARKMLWAEGIKGADITDYHIDALARFVGPGKVLIQIDPVMDPADPWSRAAHQTLAMLKGASDNQGRPLDIITLPEPVDVRVKSPSFVASYINYYVCNDAVIMAQFGDRKADDRARNQLAALYPGRRIVMLDVDALGAAGGGIHCATQQQPLTSS